MRSLAEGSQVILSLLFAACEVHRIPAARVAARESVTVRTPPLRVALFVDQKASIS
jgi:hypothetical protein